MKGKIYQNTLDYISSLGISIWILCRIAISITFCGWRRKLLTTEVDRGQRKNNISTVFTGGMVELHLVIRRHNGTKMAKETLSACILCQEERASVFQERNCGGKSINHVQKLKASQIWTTCESIEVSQLYRDSPFAFHRRFYKTTTTHMFQLSYAANTLLTWLQWNLANLSCGFFERHLTGAGWMKFNHGSYPSL